MKRVPKLNLKLIFYILLVLTVVGFITYSLYEKHKYLDKLQKKLNKDDPSDPYDYRGNVLTVDNPGHSGSIIMTGDIHFIVAAKAVEALKRLDRDHREIDFYICSNGGQLGYAMTIANAIKMVKAKVNTYAVGHCFSGATYILAAGTGKRYASKDALLDLHFISGDENASPGTHYHVMNQYVSAFWKQHTKLPSSINTKGNLTLNFSPAEGKQWGIVDVVY